MLVQYCVTGYLSVVPVAIVHCLVVGHVHHGIDLGHGLVGILFEVPVVVGNENCHNLLPDSPFVHYVPAHVVHMIGRQNSEFGDTAIVAVLELVQAPVWRTVSAAAVAKGLQVVVAGRLVDLVVQVVVAQGCCGDLCCHTVHDVFLFGMGDYYPGFSLVSCSLVLFP
jgi:hypothetical protein